MRLAFACHLSIAWFTGTQLSPKRVIALNPLQSGPEGSQPWDGSTALLPEGPPGLQQSERALQAGDDLALVVSLTRPALANAERAIEELQLPIGHRLRASCAPPQTPPPCSSGRERRRLITAPEAWCG